MSPKRASVLIVTFLCLSFSTNVATTNIGANSVNNYSFAGIEKFQQRCQQFKDILQGLTLQDAAKKLYKRAYSLSFDQDWQLAKTASACAALLHHGDSHWKIDSVDNLF